jgi:mono/diheme cytochrome c family protein
VNAKPILAGALLLAAAGAALWAATPGPVRDTPQTSQPAAKSTPQHKVSQSDDEGERIFQQNCSRCHNAPEGFSSRISGTIVRHMRMRANLSRHDEQELLKYLNP